MTEIQELREIVQAQARYIALLTHLVKRIGEDLDAHCEHTYHESSDLIYPYTVAGQREYDAAGHEAEGAPPDAVSEGAWGNE